MTEYVLEILDGDRAGETVPLAEQRITLGRKASCTLPLNDEKVSSEHAEVVFEDGRHVLRDLNSRNGTFLDGRKVDEVILTAFDTFHIGRVRLQFKEAGAEPGLALHRIGQDRLQRTGRRRGALGLAVVVVLLAGAGAWYTWRIEQTETAGPGAARSMSVPRVASNKLGVGADNCEDLEQWELSVSGSGFEPGGPARSGATALMARRLAALEGEGEPAPQDHALARVAEVVTVVPGEHLRLTGHLQTAGGGTGALRLRFLSTAEPGTALWTGTAPAEYDSYEEVSLEVAVPPGTDRAQVEVLALLPAEDAEVLVDDLALVAGGAGTAIDLSAKACTVAGVGGGIELRAGQSIVVWRVAPSVAGGPLQGLSAAGLLGFSDAGLDLGVTADEQGFHLQCRGDAQPGGFELVFGSAAAAGVRLRGGESAFTAAASDFEADVRELLLGAGPSRLLVRAPEARAATGKWVGDRFVVTFDGVAALDLVVSFDAERRAAQEAWRVAQELRDAGQLGEALDRLRELIDITPHDASLVSKALRLRSEMLSGIGQRVDELRAELRLAEFFKTRGEYVRIGQELDALVAAYGERDVPQLEGVAEMRQQVADHLAALDSARDERRKADLEALAAMFADSGDAELEKLVKTYLEKHH